MPYTVLTSKSTKERILISGVSQTGKTSSLETFVDESSEMVIVNVPGEKGVKSLPLQDNITCYTYETDLETNDVRWSVEALDGFYEIIRDLISNPKPIVAIDGIHALYEQEMNVVTSGAYLSGNEFDTKLYGACHNKFGQFINTLYYSKIPLLIMTTWEEYEFVADNLSVDQKKQAERQAQKQLWPALPGKMSKKVVGMFDARISARLEKKCIYKDCEFAKEYHDHHVWQFLPNGDVGGVGIKGLRKVPTAMYKKPWIHQEYKDLKTLMENYR